LSIDEQPEGNPQDAAPDAPAPGAAAGEGPPADLARAVAEIWSEVLGVHPVGVRDEFFSLGGDSMLAAEAAALVQARLSPAATLRLVFEQPRPCDFAAALALLPAPGAARPGTAGSAAAGEAAP
jgi:hypothetical protein